jgi:hypothetical protein
MVDAQAARPPKLPVWQTVARCYILTLQNLGWFLKLAWPWLIVLTAIVAAISWYLWPAAEAAHAAGRIYWGDLITIFPSLFIASSLAVAWHRRLLLDEANGQRLYLRADKTVAKYVLWAFALSYIAFAPIFLGGPAYDYFVGSEQTAVGQHADVSTEVQPSDVKPEEDATAADQPSADVEGEPTVEDGEVEGQWPSAFDAIGAIALIGAAFLAFAVLGFIPTRLSLILPAIALSHSEFRARDSWRLTAGNFWRLFFASLLTVVPPALFVLFLNWSISGWEDPKTQFQYILQACRIELLFLFVGMIGITLLSVTYRHFTGGDAGEEQTTSRAL